MTELKTLKDMTEALSTVEHPFKEWATWDFIKKIERQEAIKHIKELTPKKKGDKIILIHGNLEKIEWIKYFFNIIEEDLK